MPNDDMTELWNARAGTQWVRERDRYDRFLAPCGRRVLGAAAVQPGERVLDVGCGNGAMTIELAAAVAPGGAAVGLDLSRAMLEVARERAEAAGSAATFVEGDAQVAELGGPYDAIVSRFGVMFFDDPGAAFSNLFGALRPGGRLAVTCWQAMFDNEWMAVPAGAFVGVLGPPEQLPEPGAPGPFAFAERSRVEALLGGAGFDSVEVAAAADALVLGDDVEDVVSFLTRDELGRRMLEGKAPELVAAALDAARAALEPFATPEGVALRGAYWVVTARRP